MEKACENIFTDTLEDSELRILAFKVFAINPTNSKASVIKDVLDDKNTQLQSKINKIRFNHLIEHYCFRFNIKFSSFSR